MAAGLGDTLWARGWPVLRALSTGLAAGLSLGQVRAAGVTTHLEPVYLRERTRERHEGCSKG